MPERESRRRADVQRPTVAKPPEGNEPVADFIEQHVYGGARSIVVGTALNSSHAQQFAKRKPRAQHGARVGNDEVGRRMRN